MASQLIAQKNHSAIKSAVAYEKIRNLIINGVKLPGTRLVIAELEEELGIGRGAIREALMRLDKSGLVTNQPYKGMVVAAPPQMHEMECIYKLRLELELLLSREAMYRLKPKDFEVLEGLISKFKNLDSVECTFFSLDRQFHSYIYRASTTLHLCSIVDKMMDIIEVYLNLYTYENEDQSIFIEEHVKIVELLKAKKEEELAKVMHSNIMGGLKLVNNAYGKIIKQIHSPTAQQAKIDGQST